MELPVLLLKAIVAAGNGALGVATEVLSHFSAGTTISISAGGGAPPPAARNSRTDAALSPGVARRPVYEFRRVLVSLSP